jgi:hypothetical protein
MVVTDIAGPKLQCQAWAARRMARQDAPADPIACFENPYAAGIYSRLKQTPRSIKAGNAGPYNRDIDRITRTGLPHRRHATGSLG